jgi:hypothetical protein
MFVRSLCANFSAPLEVFHFVVGDSARMGLRYCWSQRSGGHRSSSSDAVPSAEAIGQEPRFRDSVTDNFRIISPRNFRVMT